MTELRQPIRLLHVHGWIDGTKRQGSATINWDGVIFVIGGRIEMLNASETLPDIFEYFSPLENEDD